MSTESNKRVQRAFFEAHDKGDWDASRALLAPGFKAYVNSDETGMDADAFEAMGSAFSTAFSSTRHILLSQVAEGDWVATRLTWTGVHTGEFQGVPASHRPVRIGAISHTRVIDGKIVEHRASIDVMGLMAQIGAIPAAA